MSASQMTHINYFSLSFNPWTQGSDPRHPCTNKEPSKRRQSTSKNLLMGID